MFDIFEGRVNPEEDWKVQLDSLPQGSADFKKLHEHLLAAYRQSFYFQCLYNSNKTVELSRFSPPEKKEFLEHLRYKLMLCIAWLSWHYHVSIGLFDSISKNNSQRARKGGKSKAARREETEAVLRALVRGQLEKRPRNGWPSRYYTSVRIGEILEPLLQEYRLGVFERGGDLTHRIDQMILDEPSLRRLYEENS